MKNSTQDLALTKQILQKPLLLQKLADRVYQLLLNDLSVQRDRTPR